MGIEYRYCPRCAAPRVGNMPFCAACAYAFPADEVVPDGAPSVPAEQSSAPPDRAVETPQAELPESRPVHSLASSSMPTKVLAAFGIVVGVLLLAGLTRPEGPLVIVLLNPIFWVAAGVTGVLLFRRDRKVLAVGVVGISAAAVVGLIAMLYYSPQVTAVASPSPSASPICWRPWFNSSGEYLSVRSECRSIPAPDFCYAGFLVKIPPPTYTADYPPGTYSAEVEKADFKRRHNHPDGACPDLDANGGWPGP